MDKKTLESLVPLYFVYLAGGLLRGRTRLQKLTFVFQMKSKESVDYEFRKDLYGPCSYKLYSIVDKLVALGFIDEETHRTQSGNSVIYYRLNQIGRSMINSAIREGEMPKQLKAIAKKVFNDYGDSSMLDLIKRVYAEYPDWTENSIFFDQWQRHRENTPENEAS
jgi:uncharacterized protein YwgA